MTRPIHLSRSAFCVALALAGATASAQGRRPSLAVEAAGGTLLNDFDHDDVDASTPMLWAAARVEVALLGPLSAQVGAAYGRFFRPRRAVPLAAGVAGLRVAPRLGRLGRLWVDLEAGAFMPGTVVRPGISAGVGLALDLTPALSLGPFARFTQVFDGRAGVGTLDAPFTPSPDQETQDLRGWSAGLSLSIHLPPRPRPTIQRATP